jgi:hypothetical protein
MCSNTAFHTTELGVRSLSLEGVAAVLAGVLMVGRGLIGFTLVGSLLCQPAPVAAIDSAVAVYPSAAGQVGNGHPTTRTMNWLGISYGRVLSDNKLAPRSATVGGLCGVDFSGEHAVL